RTFLRAASPPGRVTSLPRPARPATRTPPDPDGSDPHRFGAVLGHERGILRLPPAADRLPVVLAALDALPADGDALVLCPSVDQARALGTRLRRAGRPVAVVAHDQPGTAAAA